MMWIKKKYDSELTLFFYSFAAAKKLQTIEHGITEEWAKQSIHLLSDVIADTHKIQGNGEALQDDQSEYYKVLLWTTNCKARLSCGHLTLSYQVLRKWSRFSTTWSTRTDRHAMIALRISERSVKGVFAEIRFMSAQAQKARIGST
jgi:hypothetical protein